MDESQAALQANSFHLRTRLSQFGYFVLPTTQEWCFLVDTCAFSGTYLGFVAQNMLNQRPPFSARTCRPKNHSQYLHE
jgi:hypothetical protein